MKSKILALSKNEEFKKLLQQKKVSNKYVTIFFGHLNNKNKNRFNISFVTNRIRTQFRQYNMISTFNGAKFCEGSWSYICTEIIQIYSKNIQLNKTELKCI